MTCYYGSMIQQNHGELLENHGYLLWDIPTRTLQNTISTMIMDS